MPKRIVDFILSLLGLILLSPFFLIISLFIRLTSSGPLFFRQKRLGKMFRPFYIYKFRTMVKNAPQIGPFITSLGDPRITPIGKILRDFKIDELPQLINVLKGEMSLVGPRPEVPAYIERFRKDFETILLEKPGITDLASLKFKDEELLLGHSDDPETFYSKSVLPEKIKLAKLYVRNRSLSLDLKILLSTVITLLLSLPFPFSKGKGGRGKTVKEVAQKFRRRIITLIHTGAVILSNYAAFWLLYNGDIPPEKRSLFLRTLPIVLASRMVALHYFGLHKGLWRYTSIRDLLSLIWAVILSSIWIWAAIILIPGRSYSRSVFLMDACLLLLVLSAIRASRRVYTTLTQTDLGAKRVLIIGAGNAAEMIARDMRQNPSYNRQPVAFIDDDPKKRHLKIHDIPVLGTTKELDAAVKAVQPDEILIAIPSATPQQTRAIINRCKNFGLPIKILPNWTGVLGGSMSIADIRNLEIEDLLGRPEIKINDPEVEAKIRARQVLVTGAGGSIGSELCRQVASFQPARLILFERSENNLHEIQLDLLSRFPDLPLEVVLGDLLDGQRLEQTFGAHRPEIIFHAAAYKHVPMMEFNPLEAVRNNILGTYEVIRAADRHGAEEFVLISTDKAVYPTSVMGATKRVAEMLVQYLNSESRTKLVSVRFGNVLESNGSVVPLFREQIKRGGPVTVTHPEVKRYFITIEEAVQLVLHAAVLGEGGETFVLDMGEPMKIVDLARTMIILSGYSPDSEIPIHIVGLRPGEKVVEELFEESEQVVQTRHEKIRLARNGKVAQDMAAFVERFAAMDHQTDPADIKAVLKELIPSYCSEDAVASHSASNGRPAPTRKAAPRSADLKKM